jgi:3-dehydroquinate dehydratase/shikimate dehydrogenase
MLAAVITDLKSLQKAKAADLIELRLDYFKNLSEEEIKGLIKSCGKPVILTNRRKSEGGLFSGNESRRIGMLKSALDGRASYADIEYSSGKKPIKILIQNKKNAKIIVSFHNFKETPDNLVEIYNSIKNLNPDLIKIVSKANSVTDNFRLFDLIKAANSEKKKIIAFCMGPYGQFGRVMSLILGSKVSYASVEKGRESADGQLSLGEMISHYRIKKIDKNTKIAGLIGSPVGHSWSHIMHNAGFDKIGMNAVYLKFQVDKLKEFIDYFRQLNVLGFSVTIPHKVEIIGYLDKIDKKAEDIGAVNTIAKKNGMLIGYNTDCDGAVHALKCRTGIKGKNAVILGAGGSARAIAYGLREEGANVTILNRSVGKAKIIADYFGCGYGRLSRLEDMDYDILINATSVGMHPNVSASPVPANLLRKNSIVFDIVFNPHKTKLLKEAEKKGCKTILGFEMLVYGAMLQFRLWTGEDAPEKAMRRKVMEHLKNAGNQD